MTRYTVFFRVAISLATIGLGVGIAFAGFVYDVIFAGIPYQDPTAQMQQRYEFHQTIAQYMYAAGGIVFLCGFLATVVCVFLAMLNKSRV